MKLHSSNTYAVYYFGLESAFVTAFIEEKWAIATTPLGVALLIMQYVRAPLR